MPGAKQIGARVQRVEDPKFILGRAQYVGDVARPNMAHLCFVRSRHADARIRRIDVSRARKAPGVLGVWTGQDTRERLRPYKPRILTDVAKSFKMSAWPLVAFDTARYVGDILVVIAAESRYLAEDAVELVEVDYEPLEAVVDVERAMRSGSPLVREEWGDNVMDVARYEAGDVDAA